MCATQMSFDELKAALEAHGVVWVPRQSPYGSVVLMGLFERMHQGMLRQTFVHLNHKDEPILRDELENIYRRLAIVPDTTSWH